MFAANITQRLLEQVGRGTSKGDRSQGPKGDPRKGHRDDRRNSGYGRMVRRAMERGAPDYQPDRRKRPHARLGRAKPVKGQAQIESEFRLAIRKQLSGIKLDKLLPACPDLKYVVGVPGIRNVWQLSQQTNATMAAIPGLGPKRRAAILKYLREQRVPTVWTE